MSTVTEVREQRTAAVRMHTVPAPVRAAFRVFDRTAPGLAARWAEHIWFTLPRPRPRSGRRDGGERFTVEVDGRAVVGEAWGDGPAVFLVHGWAGNRGDLTAFVPALLARGLRVVAFDAPSHGDSAPGRFGPRSSSVPEFVAALAAVVADRGRPRAIVAHSAGATATGVALCDGLRLERLALLAPMASASAYGRRLVTLLGAGPRTYRRLVPRAERRISEPLRHFDLPELGRAVTMPPTLVIHDRDDALISVTDGAAIAAAWSRARLQVTSGLGHRRLLRDPDVIAEVVDFVSG
jgi:pimeloyl-ACP methyl ester carboxylesterase